MSATLCQMTAQYVKSDSVPDLIRALQRALAHFQSRYVLHTQNLGWDLSYVRLCVSNANQASVNAWLALPPEQRRSHLAQALSSQSQVVFTEPELRLTRAAPANPDRCITVYLRTHHGGCEFGFEFPGDFCYQCQPGPEKIAQNEKYRLISAGGGVLDDK